MLKKWLLPLMLILFVMGVSAQEFDAAKAIIDAKTACSDLSEDQLVSIGDYYMEQMHPGTAHTLMEEHMGGEDSATVRAVHLSMAQRFYCGENVSVAGVGMIAGYGAGMMGRANYARDGSSYGMMGGHNFGAIHVVVGFIVCTLVFLLLIGLVILVYVLIFRLLKKKK